MGLRRYLLRKGAWYLGALLFALILNFLLPRLVPGNPVDSIVSQMARGGGAQGEELRQIHEHFVHEFGLNKPLWEQFVVYVGNLLHGDMGTSFANYPAPVNSIIGEALPWSIALLFPSIIIGWIVGNLLGAIAAFKGGWSDRGAFLGSLLLSSVPYYCLGIVLLYLLAIVFPVLPPGGGYDYGTMPELSFSFFTNAMTHYWLPFASLVLVFIGGQAVGMRSMAIYELGADYVGYSRGLGLPDSRVVRYIFRNAMLPQVTGLALAIGVLVGGQIITEIVFNYPGIGTLLFTAINQRDYPVIQGITLLIAVTVLIANFLVELVYGLIDPRIKAVQEGER